MRRLLPALVLFATAWPLAGPARAADRHIEVVQVEGAIDPVVADLITTTLRQATTSGASVVILQIDSPGALDTDPVSLLRAVSAARVPVAAWVG
ncbi:MAG: NfeD family protein, partial [Acidimicrobiia bacterium]